MKNFSGYGPRNANRGNETEGGGEMHTMDKYTDADDKELTLLALVKKEPAWAANVIGSLKIKLKEAEQRAEQAKKDLAATRIEAAEILHNKQAKIEVLKTAERDAVRKLRGLLEDALPHISCTTKEQSDLVTEIGKALYEEKDQ